MNPEVEALMRFQSGGSYSMPLQPGDRARINGMPEIFTVLAFDGHVYRLQAQSGAELKAGQKTVERAWTHETKAHEASVNLPATGSIRHDRG